MQDPQDILTSLLVYLVDLAFKYPFWTRVKLPLTTYLYSWSIIQVLFESNFKIELNK